MNLADCTVAIEAVLGRKLGGEELAAVERLFNADRPFDDILDTIRDLAPIVQATDDELPTVRFEPAGDEARRIP